MSLFEVYFIEGRNHILDYVNGYDHILFVVALCAVYVIREWKQILILVTAFTIGHSITLALSTLNIINAKTSIIEFLIPLTILITSISNILKRENTITQSRVQLNYFLALFFGLIHGMGFSYLLRALLGKNDSILTPLFAFNIGLEYGQIIIVGIFLAVSFIVVNLAGLQRRIWKIVISSITACFALYLMISRVV